MNKRYTLAEACGILDVPLITFEGVRDLTGYLERWEMWRKGPLKKAWRRVAKKYHPDRLVGKSEEERAQAESDFKLRNNVYHDLLNVDPKAFLPRRQPRVQIVVVHYSGTATTSSTSSYTSYTTRWTHG